MADTETSQQPSTNDNPQIEQSDLDAFDKLADEVNLDGSTPEGHEEKPEPVQKPVTPTPEKVTPEAKPAVETKPEVKPIVPAPEIKPGEEVKPTEEKKPEPDPELDGIKEPKNLSPKSLEGWKGLKATAYERGQKVKALEKELMEVKPLVGKPDPKLEKEVTTLKQELGKYQALFQNENSPEFKAKYDTPKQENEARALEILERNGLPKDVLEKIKTDGIMSVKSSDITAWVKALNLDDGEALKKAYLGNKELTTAKAKALEEIHAKPEEFQKQMAEEQTKEFQAYTQKIDETVAALTKDISWARLQEVPANATPEQKAQIEADNAFYKESEQRFRENLYPATPEKRVQTNLESCLAYKLADDNKKLEASNTHWYKESQRLQGEIDAIKKAGVTSRAGANLAVGGIKKPLDTSKMSDDEAIEAGLDLAGA